VSALDLNRNLRDYIEIHPSPLDFFAPGWRDKVDVSRPDKMVRAKIREHWRDLLKQEGMNTTEAHELVEGEQRQPLYWLAFAARHDLALQFWEKIRRIRPAQQLQLI
jgi:hypothetical protein